MACSYKSTVGREVTILLQYRSFIHHMLTMEFQSLASFLVLNFKGSTIFGLFLIVISVGNWYLKHNSQLAVGYWPFLRNLPALYWNSHCLYEWMTRIFISLGKSSFYVKGPIFSKLSYLMTCDPQNLEYILKTNFNNFPKGPDFRQVFDILGDGIFTVDSDLWRVQRRMAHASFSSAEFRTLVAKTSRNIVEDQLIPFLAHAAKQETVIDLQDVCLRFAYDSNMSTIVGNNERYLSVELPSSEFAEASDDAQEAIFMRHVMPTFLWKLMHWLGIGREKKLANASKTVDRIFEKCISEKRQDLLKGIETYDILSSYIKSGQEMSNKFLRDAMLNLTAAGKDAIASGLVWFFWLVYTTPSVEMKILEELNNLVLSLKNKRHGADDDNWPWVFNSEDLKGLVYLHAALCESLRLYPPVPINSKDILQEDVLPDGTKVKPGVRLLLSMYSVGRMPWIWGKDCLEFKPQRWIDSDTGKLSQECMSKFFSFNAGPRTCMGKDMSFTQMKSAVAAVIFNFHVEVMEGHHVCTRPAINLQMKNGLMVKVKKRLSIVR